MTPQIARPTSEERLREAAKSAELTECEEPHRHWHYRGLPVDADHPHAALTPAALLALLDRLDQLKELAEAARVYLRGGRSMSHPGSGGDPDAMERLRNFQDALARLDSDTPATEPER